MSKQVILKGNVLHVRTSEDYDSANKVICLKQGKKAKVFYPVVPSFITDLEVVKDWTICGYRVEDLYKLSLILHDRNVSEVDLRDYNEAFVSGYNKAHTEIQAQLENSVKNIINGVTGVREV